MKRRSLPAQRNAPAPYTKQAKAPFGYGARVLAIYMYYNPEGNWKRK